MDTREESLATLCPERHWLPLTKGQGAGTRTSPSSRQPENSRAPRTPVFQSSAFIEEKGQGDDDSGNLQPELNERLIMMVIKN